MTADATTVGLRELRQHASDLVRQVEAGDEITITVAGRPSARLVPIAGPRRWQSFDEIADIFVGAPDRGWETDRDLIDQQLRDPWGET
ncbi:type II toxin-antitoxin system prevent-host-death family antitoxin [Saccharopolyspora oryzae]|uniref:Antitoxin n=1 Tax=Saccharopolyspora oryzae TaxID=2997343 RepID=A0ABT4V5T1_9PSEU|nr:type II toxin-antitoxin system prevent-host-death family antitoxin [Saccharopolyspora oryzae]MDA3629309.1 type II toxin-antitoxin system prevent-host-death family antitoxin [Saccharopolyspora oryzae]